MKKHFETGHHVKSVHLQNGIGSPVKGEQTNSFGKQSKVHNFHHQIKCANVWHCTQNGAAEQMESGHNWWCQPFLNEFVNTGLKWIISD